MFRKMMEQMRQKRRLYILANMEKGIFKGA